MQQTSILDLGIGARASPPRQRKLLKVCNWRFAGAVALFAVVLALLLGGDWLTGGSAPSSGKGQAVGRLLAEQARRVEAMTVDDKAQIVVEGQAAEARNAAIPVSGLPIEQARQFILFGAANNYANALRCMTQAVYYEAASEPMQGRQAVAQVVLNRVRHPAYPNSVCGVVYQGSARRTGCQFSFTCDGSLLRTPMAGAWRQAEAVARAALGGFVESTVGTATHYHADYVLPKWAFQLAKIEQLGRHIFYRFPGQMGRALAFNGRYNQAEFIPMIDRSALQLRIDEAGTLLPLPVDPQFTPGLTVAPSASDRHAPADVGGRIDMTRTWRLNIPDPTQASARYKAALGEASSESTEADPVEAMAAAEGQPAARP